MLATIEVSRHRPDPLAGYSDANPTAPVLVRPSVHMVQTLTCRRPLDVAFLSGELVVQETLTLGRVAVCRPRWRAAYVIEAPAHTMTRWALKPGDRLEIRTGHE